MPYLMLVSLLAACGSSTPQAPAHCDDRDYSGYCYELQDSRFTDATAAAETCKKYEGGDAKAGSCPTDGGALGPRLHTCEIGDGVVISMYTTTHKTVAKATDDCKELKEHYGPAAQP